MGGAVFFCGNYGSPTIYQMLKLPPTENISLEMLPEYMEDPYSLELQLDSIVNIMLANK
ncbi:MULTISPECIES: hypothetical protein [Paenibacillus]|uniref:hypothetical protein n=1 Tax=Paenibacillus TaxID=44249 RepID=UPI0015C2DE2B|nr:hypothetical protein [Paenibacillus borealis]